jgi:hypothetical protein
MGSLVELEPLLPHPIEVVFAVAIVVTVLFLMIAYAIIKMVTRQWPFGLGLSLIVFALVVPFGGAVLLAAL